MDEPQYTHNQDKILYQIKRLGPQSVKSLALTLQMTTMGARQHLMQLADDGLVEKGDPESQKRGRPVSRWQLTEEGHKRFPDAHAQVTTEIIASVRDVLGDAALDQVIEARSRETLARYQARLSGISDTVERLNALAALRSEEGYMAEVSEAGKGTFLLIENHCPICIAAQHCQGFCQSELNCFQQVFSDVADVTREEYLLEGARRCTYRVTVR